MGVTVVVGGWVPKDPEYGDTKSGKKKVTFNMCAFGKKDEPFWLKVMVFEERLNNVLTYVRKGSRVIISGEMAKLEPYTGRDGVLKCEPLIFATGITLVPGGNSDSQDKPKPTGYQSETTHMKKQMGGSETEEIPF